MLTLIVAPNRVGSHTTGHVPFVYCLPPPLGGSLADVSLTSCFGYMQSSLSLMFMPQIRVALGEYPNHSNNVPICSATANRKPAARKGLGRGVLGTWISTGPNTSSPCLPGKMPLDRAHGVGEVILRNLSLRYRIGRQLSNYHIVPKIKKWFA